MGGERQALITKGFITMNNELFIYKNDQGKIIVDAIFEEKELKEKEVVSKMENTTQHGAIKNKLHYAISGHTAAQLINFEK